MTYETPQDAVGDDRSVDGWLVMLYLAGDNNLTEEMVLTLHDIRSEGTPSGDRIVAQLDPGAVGVFSTRYDFDERSGGTTLEDFKVPEFGGEHNTGNPQTLVDFVTWALDRYGTNRRLLLILSGHGSGTTEDFLLKDENAADSLSIPELRDALTAIVKVAKRPVDILGFDACFMSMGEVADALRGKVDIVIGAEGEEPAFGWPFREVLEQAKAERLTLGGRPLDPEKLADLIVRFT